MYLILPLLFFPAILAASDTEKWREDSPVFDDAMKEFESRRLFAQIVDDSYIPFFYRRDRYIVTLIPSEHPEYFDFFLRKSQNLKSNCETEDTNFEEEPLLYGAKLFKRTIEVTAEVASALTRGSGSYATFHNKLASLISNYTKTDEIKCVILPNKFVMSFFLIEQLSGGWIVERYPLGKFSKNKSPIEYEYPIYYTNYSHIDGITGKITDVVKKVIGKMLPWHPSGASTFARSNIKKIIIVDNRTDFTFIQKTVRGRLIATLNTHVDSYSKSGNSTYGYSKNLYGRNHLYLPCPTEKLEDDGWDSEFSYKIGNLTEECPGSTIDENPNHAIALDEIFEKPVESTTERLNTGSIREGSTTTGQPTKLIFIVPTEASDDESALSSFSTVILVVVILAIIIGLFLCGCVAEHVKKSRDPVVQDWIKDRHGEDRRREKNGRYSYFTQAELADASRQSLEAINKKSEEFEKEEQPSRRSTRKITFAPKKSTVNQQRSLEFGERVDAMVEAGAVEAPATEKVQQGAAPSAASAAKAAAAAAATAQP